MRPKLACSRPAPRLPKQALRSAARSPDLAALSDEILIGIYKEIYAQEIKMSVEEEGESILPRPLPHDLPHGRPPSLVTSLPPSLIPPAALVLCRREDQRGPQGEGDE